MESEFPSNSKDQPSKSEKPASEKKVQQVTSRPGIKRKKPMHKRLVEKFTGGENAISVMDYVVMDIVIPAARDLFVDALYAGVERKVYGEVRSSGRRGYSRGVGHVNYNGISSGSVRRNMPSHVEDPRMSRRARATHDFGEILIPSRVEANAVIDQMFEILSRYEIVTVADLYDLVGVPSTFQDNKWGWDDLRGADSERVRDGYLLTLPRPIPID